MLTKYDKTREYASEIEEKVTELIQLCNRERLPMFLAIAVKNDEEGTEYVKEMFSSASNNIYLKEDYIPRFINVTNGFMTIPPAEDIEIEFE